MAVKSITCFIGYIGMSAYYHTLYYEVPDKIHPKHHKRNVPQQNLILTNRRKFGKIHRNKKRSNNYEGTGKNYKDFR